MSSHSAFWMGHLSLIFLFSIASAAEPSTEYNYSNETQIECDENQFHCGKICIPIIWVCDSSSDCPDGRDEENCNHTLTTTTVSTISNDETIVEQVETSSYEEIITTTEAVIEDTSEIPEYPGNYPAEVTTAEFEETSENGTSNDTILWSTGTPTHDITMENTENMTTEETVVTESSTPTSKEEHPNIDYDLYPNLKFLINLTKEINHIKNKISNGGQEANSSCSIALEREKKQLTSKLTCPHHFQFISSRCIYVQVYPPHTWSEASSICESHGSSLVRIRNNLMLKKLLQQLTFDRQRIYSFWIGAKRDYMGHWRWQDGQPVEFLFASDYNTVLFEKTVFHLQPLLKGKMCAFLDGNRASLLTKGDCDVPKGFICERKVKSHQNY